MRTQSDLQVTRFHLKALLKKNNFMINRLNEMKNIEATSLYLVRDHDGFLCSAMCLIKLETLCHFLEPRILVNAGSKHSATLSRKRGKLLMMRNAFKFTTRQFAVPHALSYAFTTDHNL